jgi:hypothetical protein
MSARTTFRLLLCLALAAQTGQAAADPQVDTSVAFERLKTLVGEWRSDHGTETLSYELIAGGSALLERDTAPDRPAMLTLYHPDGNRLMLTHYCMAGNQPRMLAKSFDAGTDELAFEFLDATNLAGPGVGHMHTVKIRFVADGRIETEWQFYEHGQAAMTHRARYTRVR